MVGHVWQEDYEFDEFGLHSESLSQKPKSFVKV